MKIQISLISILMLSACHDNKVSDDKIENIANSETTIQQDSTDGNNGGSSADYVDDGDVISLKGDYESFVQNPPSYDYIGFRFDGRLMKLKQANVSPEGVFLFRVYCSSKMEVLAPVKPYADSYKEWSEAGFPSVGESSSPPRDNNEGTPNQGPTTEELLSFQNSLEYRVVGSFEIECGTDSRHSDIYNYIMYFKEDDTVELEQVFYDI